MKIVLIGANGTIGELVQKALAGAGHEIVKVGRKSGDFQVEIENRESVRKLYQAVGSFDAVAIAAGEVAFAQLSELTAEKWQFSLGSKLMGRSIWFRRRSRSSKKKDPSLWFRAFLTTNRSSPASRLQPSRARWKVLFGLLQLNFLWDCVSTW
jgi:NAD dependent epimerase/dehydratase family